MGLCIGLHLQVVWKNSESHHFRSSYRGVKSFVLMELRSCLLQAAIRGQQGQKVPLFPYRFSNTSNAAALAAALTADGAKGSQAHSPLVNPEDAWDPLTLLVFCPHLQTLSGRDIEYHLSNANIMFYEDLTNGTTLLTRLGKKLLITNTGGQEPRIPTADQVPL